MPPLTDRQARALSALESAGRIERVPVDPTRAAILMDKSAKLIAQIPRLDFPDAQHTLAYNACHSCADALLAQLGYRTKSGPGQHEALALALAAVVDGPPGDEAAQAFNQLRRTRNAGDYRAVPIGQAQADHASHVAREIWQALHTRGVGAP